MDRSRNLRTVTNDKWGVSVETGDGIAGARLTVYQFPKNWKFGKPFRKGIGYGMIFASSKEAFDFAYEHGYLQPYYKKARKFQ